jgi:hypothetical protein
VVVVQLTVLSQDIQVCRKCGIVFDLNIRQNKDCPLCSAGEHTELRMNNKEREFCLQIRKEVRQSVSAAI